MYVTVPLVVSFVAIGTYLSSLEVQSITFTAASIVVTLISWTQIYFACVWASYAFLIPVHSNNVLSILFNRIFDRMGYLTRASYSIDGHLRFDLETSEREFSVQIHQWVKRAQQEVKKRHEILKIIENVLKQMELHNETVKHIMDKAISFLIPGFGLAIVFFATERGDLLRHMFSAGAALMAFIFYISLLKSYEVYTLTKRLSFELHAIQARLRGKGMKSQLQILRLIQKTSDCESWHRLIGFTVGDQASLSPKLVLSSFLQTISVALTFLNAKSD